jgi:hypothetical protein
MQIYNIYNSNTGRQQVAYTNLKVKVALYQATKRLKGSRGIALLSIDLGARRVEW